MEPTTSEAIGPHGHAVRTKVHLLRRKRGLTQKDLSDQLTAAGRPILSTVISKIERGERRVDIDDLFAFAAVLGVTPAQLLEPPEDCTVCHGRPPAGFACLTCGSGPATA